MHRCVYVLAYTCVLDVVVSSCDLGIVQKCKSVPVNCFSLQSQNTAADNVFSWRKMKLTVRSKGCTILCRSNRGSLVQAQALLHFSVASLFILPCVAGRFMKVLIPYSSERFLSFRISSC